ncbi:urease subunit gamma [Streptomyces rubiginosohelvolus]|uniref:urease subunit gamma n=1 Tax=Streptomyces rubiginosohelvolus TaxID=67362 RepID=UPI0036CD85AF
MPLTPAERDRLLLFTAAELARARRARGLRLNVPEATALIADTVCEAARDGHRPAGALERGRSVLTSDDILPGVADVVTEIHVEAVFEEGVRLAVVSDPFGGGHSGDSAPGAVLPGPADAVPELVLTVRNTAPVLRSIAKLTVNPAIAHGLAHEIGSIEVGKMPDIALWRPAFFGAKPQMVLKNGFPAYGVTGDPNAANDACEPLVLGPLFGAHGAAPADLSVAFVSRAAAESG